MKLPNKLLPESERLATIKSELDSGKRLGLISSIDGSQLLTVLINPSSGDISCFETPVVDQRYRSLTPLIAQAHWFERVIFNMFGLHPDGHPRLKTTHLHEHYGTMPPPLSSRQDELADPRTHEFLRVDGEGVYELPVGPIHAGLIEPGHFRFSCYGEQIVNLEIQLGWVHRGLEKRLTEIPWQHGRFLVEAAASDMPVANALAYSLAIESLFDLQVDRITALHRYIALETERIAMHLGDFIGLAGDIGFVAVAASMSQLRGEALRVAEILSGNRFMRAFVKPGDVSRYLSSQKAIDLKALIRQIRIDFTQLASMLFENEAVIDRMEGVGRVAPSLAADFGLVGVAGRASGSNYDCRAVWRTELFPSESFTVAGQSSGDVLARALVRRQEVFASLDEVEKLLDNVNDPPQPSPQLPTKLPTDALALGVVESHRGELLHLIKTNKAGEIVRYCIKDASINNWTGLAIAVRNNVIADFPLCNKSFSLSYSGHDL